MSDLKHLLEACLRTMRPDPPPRPDHRLHLVAAGKQKVLVATARRVRRENLVAALKRKVIR